MLLDDLRDDLQRPLKQGVVASLVDKARRRREKVLMVQLHRPKSGPWVIFANDSRNGRMWIWGDDSEPTTDFVETAFAAFTRDVAKDVLIFPHGALTALCRDLAIAAGGNTIVETENGDARLALPAYPDRVENVAFQQTQGAAIRRTDRTTHLDRLEAESMFIMREVVAEAENPVMMYSIGKDSAVMLHLARKAFYPSPPPFPLLHVDTRWKFQAMYAFRDLMAKGAGMDLIVHVNPEGVEKNINPIDHGSQLHTDIMKTQGLKQALDHYGFDAAFGGARRDEEKSRAKERIFSLRSASHRWDPKNQRPELWSLFNGRKKTGESIRAFPLSNWTELDIWQYIYREQIPIVPLYFAAERPVVERDNMLIMVDDDRLTLLPGEEIQFRDVRFRTLGCYPLTGAIESNARDLPAIILELLQARTSERQGRAIDNDASASMEKKKAEGYF
ncbi:MAG: sulfate adenylyltransferase subunit 2 [Alphaproteobacteria bacterium]